MKKFFVYLCLLLAVCIPTGCASYTPKKEDFEFSVSLERTVYTQGETIEYTVKLTRVSGGRFRFQGSSTLCTYSFDTIDKSPAFAFNDDVSNITIGKDYKYEATNKIQTEYYEPGEYLLAVRFFLPSLEYSFDREITILPQEN